MATLMSPRREIRRLLIANRGEIAVRIARTAARMGMDTVAVYSEPDRNALHVDVVDVAVPLHGSSPGDSYLVGEAIIDAALKTGCDAIHPGYGFLAENAAFARDVEQAGLLWVGPTATQMELLGDKISAKRAAREAGVPTSEVIELAPGAMPQDPPLPALIKAAAGGGGRGMRIVHTLEDLPMAVDAASREAAASFGDGTVFLEPYVDRGRHVEVQILGDLWGNVIHLGERECSIQRRNQKILEEAPSAGIDESVRARLYEGALALANHVGYIGAGTVEFLVGADGTITFLEVNTRLQVEHPVTEAITGLDLVELQLRVAAGDPLPLGQEEVRLHGHAIEARVVAEDPVAGWTPSIGTITAFDFCDAVRVDTGFQSGSEVFADYDSLLAKVIAVAPDRGEAARRLTRALRRSRVAGVRTNLHALVAVLEDADFLAARTPTSFLDDHPGLVHMGGPDGDDRLALLLGAVFALDQKDRATDPVTGFAPTGYRNLWTQGQRQVWLSDAEPNPVEYVMRSADRAEVRVGPWPVPDDDGSLGPDTRRVLDVRLLRREPHRQTIEVDDQRRVVDVFLDGDLAHTRTTAGALTWALQPRFTDHDPSRTVRGPVSPLPGAVVAVQVVAGQRVREGDLLVAIEAMKMEHRITATAEALVSEVLVAEGQRVEAGDLLVALEMDPPPST